MEREFDIEIKEVLSRVETVKAESLDDAINKAMDMYYSEQIVLDAEDMKGVDFSPYSEEQLPSSLNREYSQRIEKLKIQADEYRQAASQYESAEKTVAQLKAEMLRFKGKRKLTQEMVDLFVAQVRIYENKNLEIVLNYEDELKKFAELNMEREAG